MIIQSPRFGELEYREEQVIEFVEGPFGFPTAKRFIIFNHPNSEVFKWLQSVDDPEVAFVITEPFLFFPQYEFDIDEANVELLEIKDSSKVLTFVILVVPPDPKKITANLKAPIVINGDNRKGKQIILMDNRFSTKHYLIEQ